MNLRLDFELALRRHGWPLPVVLAACLALAAVLGVAGWNAFAPPATVPATDGTR